MRWPWQKAETDLDREVQHHLETLADAYQREGMSRDEAMRQARREFGGLDRAKEGCRDERWWNPLARVGQDLTFGWRMMRKTPAISVSAVILLALGIGATTAMVSFADALLWRQLRVPEPQRLSEVLWQAKKRSEVLANSTTGSLYLESGLHVADFFSTQAFRSMKSAAAGKAEVAAQLYPNAATANFRGAIVIVGLRPVSGNFFSMLRLNAMSGRVLEASDDRPEASPVIVVSHRFWSQQLGADPSAVGDVLRVNNTLYTIAGVLPETFTGIEPGDRTDLYAPIYQSPRYLQSDSWIRRRGEDPETWWLQLMARRAPGVSPAQLQALLDPSFASSWPTEPESAETTPKIRITEAGRGLGSMSRSLGDPVWILLGLVVLVLVVVCANVANLMLARGAARSKEFALRVSLGCGRARLVRQLLTESAVIAALGGLLSIPVALGVAALLADLVRAATNGVDLAIELDGRVLAGTAVATLFAAIAFGLYPAWRSTRIEASPELKEGSGSAGTISRSRWAPAKVLVLVQVSLGLLLVTSAILFTTQLNEIIARDTGFERNHTLLFDVRPGELGYREGRLQQFYVELENRLSALPGVVATGLAINRPMRGGGNYTRSRLKADDKEGVRTALHNATAGFLEALGVPVVAGRSLSVEDVLAGRPVVVISQTLAKELGLSSPVGARVMIDGTAEYEVVGIARDAHYARMNEELPALAYLPFNYKRATATVVVRTSVPPLAILGAAREALAALDRDIPMMDIYTMEQQISRTLRTERLFAWLCGCFGVLALILCAVGLYGLMSHTTARRTAEIGIRKAVGASSLDVTWQVLREGMVLAGIGLALGAPLAWAGMRLGESQNLLSEGPIPYGILFVSTGVLAASALLATLAPAVRASSVDPMTALRRG